jgi:hypothetical protein
MRFLILVGFALVWSFALNWGMSQATSWVAKGLVLVVAASVYGLGARLVLRP